MTNLSVSSIQPRQSPPADPIHEQGEWQFTPAYWNVQSYPTPQAHLHLKGRDSMFTVCIRAASPPDGLKEGTSCTGPSHMA